MESQCKAGTAPSFSSNWTLQTATIQSAATTAGDRNIPLSALRAAEANRRWRYFTAFRCDQDVCIIFKDDTNRRGTQGVSGFTIERIHTNW